MAKAYVINIEETRNKDISRQSSSTYKRRAFLKGAYTSERGNYEAKKVDGVKKDFLAVSSGVFLGPRILLPLDFSPFVESSDISKSIFHVVSIQNRRQREA